jgi:hypothetical protein
MGGAPDRRHQQFMMEADTGDAFHRNKKRQTRGSKKWQSGAGPKLCVSNGAEV